MKNGLTWCWSIVDASVPVRDVAFVSLGLLINVYGYTTIQYTTPHNFPCPVSSALLNFPRNQRLTFDVAIT